MKTVYCISGLGADEKAFGKLTINDASIKHLPWLPPNKNEKIEAYAARMANGISDANPVLIGLSFGGIMSIEIAKIIPVQKIILISSIKTSAELPVWMKLCARLKLNKIFPLKSFRAIEPIQNKMLGITSSEEKKMVRNYRKNVSLAYTNWAVNAIFQWKNNVVHSNIIHIHGTADKMFPVKKVKASHIVNGGTHFMIMSRAKEISAIINETIQAQVL